MVFINCICKDGKTCIPAVPYPSHEMTEEIGPLPLLLHLLHSNVQIFICQGIGIGNIVFMFHCLNWDHHLATVVHLWKKKGMNGKVGHASNLKSWWGHIIAQFQNGTDIFFLSENNEKIKFKKLYWRGQGEKLHSWGHIIAQIQMALTWKNKNYK